MYITKCPQLTREKKEDKSTIVKLKGDHPNPELFQFLQMSIYSQTMGPTSLVFG